MRIWAVLLFVGCDRAPPPLRADAGPPIVIGGERRIRASGSSAGQPLLEAAKERFEARYKGKSIELSAGGSQKGISDVASGAVHIGSSDVSSVVPGLVDHRIAVVGFASMANRGEFDSQIASLSKETLAGIFSGAVRDWSDVGGSAQPIVVIYRAAGSGSRRVFAEYIMGGASFVETQTEENSGALVARLKRTPGAISYAALSFRDPELLTLGIGEARPSEAAIAEGAWPLWSYEHLYTRGEATDVTKVFVEWMLGPEFQNDVLPTMRGYVPIARMRVARDGW